MASSSTRGGQFDFEGEGVGRFLKQIREALKKKRKKEKKRKKREKRKKVHARQALYHAPLCDWKKCLRGVDGGGGGAILALTKSPNPQPNPPPKKNTPSLPARPSKAK